MPRSVSSLAFPSRSPCKCSADSAYPHRSGVSPKRAFDPLDQGLRVELTSSSSCPPPLAAGLAAASAPTRSPRSALVSVSAVRSLSPPLATTCRQPQLTSLLRSHGLLRYARRRRRRRRSAVHLHDDMPASTRLPRHGATSRPRRRRHFSLCALIPLLDRAGGQT